MKNVFSPFKGVKNISFGYSRSQIKNILNSKVKTFLRSEFSENTTDYFYELGFFVEYDEQDICQTIEFTCKSNLHFENVNLFNYNSFEFKERYGNLSLEKEIEEGIDETYYDLGFGFFPSPHFTMSSDWLCRVLNLRIVSSVSS